jgi:hypothetical protein
VRGARAGMRQEALDQVFAVGPKARLAVVESEIEASVGRAIQDGELIEFTARPQVERVHGQRLARRCDGLLGPAQMTQHGSFQVPGLQVIGVRAEPVFEVFEGGPEVAAEAIDGRQRMVSGRLPGEVPSGFVECRICLRKPALVFEHDTQMVGRLAIVRVRVAFGQTRESAPEVLLCFAELATTQLQPPHGVVRPRVVRIAVERFTPIEFGIACGMPVLLQVQTGKIELLVGGHLSRYGRFAGRRR